MWCAHELTDPLFIRETNDVQQDKTLKKNYVYTPQDWVWLSRMDLFVSFSSPFFRFLFCLCCFVAFISADPNFVSTYYERINVDDLTTNLKTLSTVIETTRFNCAITCNKVQDCTIVSFHRGKKVCRLLGEDKLGMSPEESFEKGNVVFFKKVSDFIW